MAKPSPRPQYIWPHRGKARMAELEDMTELQYRGTVSKAQAIYLLISEYRYEESNKGLQC